MKHLYLVLLLLPAQLLGQPHLPRFVNKSMRDVGKMLAAQHLAFDTSFRFPPRGPEVDYIAYAPYKIGNIPGVLVLRGRDTINVVRWYSRGVDVDSDLNWVIARKPDGPFARAVKKLGHHVVSAVDFNRLVSVCSRDLGSPAKRSDSRVTWPNFKFAWLHDGIVQYNEVKPIHQSDFQPTTFAAEKAAEIRSHISTGLYGLTKNEVEQALKGLYEAAETSRDDRSTSFAPYNLHGIDGVLTVIYGPGRIARIVSWRHKNDGSILPVSSDSTSRFARIVRSIQNDIRPEQYNQWRESLGLPRLENPNGIRTIALQPVYQVLTYELGSLQYSESPGRGFGKGVYIVGAEPTIDIGTGR